MLAVPRLLTPLACLLAIGFWVIRPTDSLKCYECTMINGTKCAADPFSATDSSAFAIECPAGTKSCSKKKADIGMALVVRSCTTPEEEAAAGANANNCKSYKTDFFTGDECYCSTDLCNDAKGLRLSPALAGAAVLAVAAVVAATDAL